MLKVLVEERSEAKTLKSHIGEMLSCTQEGYHFIEGQAAPGNVPTGLREAMLPPKVYEGPLNQEAYRTINTNRPSLGIHLSTSKGTRPARFDAA